MTSSADHNPHNTTQNIVQNLCEFNWTKCKQDDGNHAQVIQDLIQVCMTHVPKMDMSHFRIMRHATHHLFRHQNVKIHVPLVITCHVMKACNHGPRPNPFLMDLTKNFAKRRLGMNFEMASMLCARCDQNVLLMGFCARRVDKPASGRRCASCGGSSGA